MTTATIFCTNKMFLQFSFWFRFFSSVYPFPIDAPASEFPISSIESNRIFFKIAKFGGQIFRNLNASSLEQIRLLLHSKMKQHVLTLLSTIGSNSILGILNKRWKNILDSSSQQCQYRRNDKNLFAYSRIFSSDGDSANRVLDDLWTTIHASDILTHVISLFGECLPWLERNVAEWHLETVLIRLAAPKWTN